MEAKEKSGTGTKSIALIGLGRWGKNLFRNLHEMGVLHSACDQDENAFAPLREKSPDVRFTTDIEVLLRDKQIRAIVIAAPSPLHYSVAKRALAAGKDVFVEKPMALTFKEGEELVEISKRLRRIFMVGHILQYHPAVVKLKELIATGELGRIQYVYSNRLNIGTLRTEENIWWSFAPHDISVILSLLNEDPIKLHAFGGDYINKGNFDTTMVNLEFPNGVKAHIFVSWLHPFKEQKLVVVGSRGMVVFDDTSEEKLFLYPHRIEWRDGKIPEVHKAEFQVVKVSKAEPLRLELSHFLDCVDRRITPLTDGVEGLRVTAVLERAQNYLQTGSSEPSPFFLHQTSIVDKGVRIGAGTKIWHFSHVLTDTDIGDNCVLGQNVMAGPHVKIGHRVKIQNNVSVYEGVEMEDDVFCGPSVVFTNVINPRAFIERKTEFRKTVIGKGASLGANATLICGVTIGTYAMVAAGAVVTKDVAPQALVAGIPARQIGWVCVCGTTLKIAKGQAQCAGCESEFSLLKGSLSKKVPKKIKTGMESRRKIQR